MAVDLDALWNFGDPAASEARFRAALTDASADDALILQTQIARTWGLRGDFDRARAILAGVEPQLAHAGAQVRVRYALELGRSYSSAAHPESTQTPQVKELARVQYRQAYETARAQGMDGLAIDALHMMAFVDTAPADQLRWDQQALAIALASTQPGAKKWEASLRNNLGYALHDLGRLDEAQAQFAQALSLRERGTDALAIRIARWMVAWNLRALGRLDEALQMQLQLEREWDAAAAPSPYVYEELELLYRAKGDEVQAAFYAQRKAALAK